MSLLKQVFDALVPPDDLPGATACGAVEHWRQVRQTHPEWEDPVEEFLAALEARGIEHLAKFEHLPGFRILNEVAQEAYLIDPRSWPAMGFEVRE